jgi:hypothetical protein
MVVRFELRALHCEADAICLRHTFSSLYFSEIGPCLLFAQAGLDYDSTVLSFLPLLG